MIKLNRNLWNFLTICTIFFMNIIANVLIANSTIGTLTLTGIGSKPIDY